jgi:wyosine [tRNA(Phe)-imidazoG37] synthetase (radical SAM superfamily)
MGNLCCSSSWVAVIVEGSSPCPRSRGNLPIRVRCVIAYIRPRKRGSDMSFTSSLKVAKHYYDKDRNGPVMIDLHPTLACQNKCSFCISANFHVSGIERANFNRKHQLDWDVLKKVVGELDDMNVKSVQLTGGGEPTLYPHFADLLYELKTRGIKVGLITNGIKVGEYAKELLDTVDWMRFSLDASNPNMYRQIKVTEHFDDVMASIERVTQLRKESNLRKIRIGVAYIITHESMSGIGEITNRFIQEGTDIDYLQFKDVVMRGMTLTPYYHQVIEKKIEEARYYAKDFEVMYTKHGGVQTDQENMKRCNATDYVAILGADGNVYPCCHLEYIPEVSYGSVYEKPIRTIWEKRPELKIREELCWNCRFSEINKVISDLNTIQDECFL